MNRNYKYCYECYTNNNRIDEKHFTELDAISLKHREVISIEKCLDTIRKSSTVDERLQYNTNNDLSVKAANSKNVTLKFTKEQITSRICKAYLKKIYYVHE